MEQPTSGTGGSQKLDFLGDMPFRGRGVDPPPTKQKKIYRHNVKITFCPLNWILNIYILQQKIFTK